MTANRLDRVSYQTILRAGARLFLLLAFGLIQAMTPWGSVAALRAMFGFSSALCAGAAILRRERLLAPALRYWDESLFFLMLFAIACVI